MSHPSAHSPAKGSDPSGPSGASAPKDFRGLPDHEKYDRSSGENPDFWYDPEMGLQRLERLRFPYFEKHLGPFAGKRVLDVGCGGGILAEDLARAGARVTGVDASRVTVEAARQHAAKSGLDIEYRHGFGEDLAFTGEFDVAFAVDSLEHVNDLAKTLDGIARALKPGAGFGFLTHNQTLEAFTEIIWKWEYQGDSAKGGHDFHKFITPDDLTRFLAERGLTVRHVQGIAWTDAGPALAAEPRVSYMGYATKS